MPPLSSDPQIVRCIASLRDACQRFSRHDGGATAIEYGLVCTFVGLAILAGLQVFGSTLMQAYPKIVSFPTIE
ncbi:Flp family type IVb pilin [Methylobacterium sp. R2-1]|uniref:Flp family type IVb pilin n=1 Tax=Methylobacterium sp. R2-1 TaxID=2587064 RepID=UPI0017FC23CC|nr:Flp family type IVb pilin [Methylobacterium sp. R2-1]MBB2959775.1 pilus assembly protein Flp/PilA [Methylobacterium sp. R2-1]